MRIDVDGTMEVNDITVRGLGIGEWVDVELEIAGSPMGIRLTISGIHPGPYGMRREMAEIHIGNLDGLLSVHKPIYRPNHDHDDSVNYHEVRGVTRNPSADDVVTDHPLSVIPIVVDY